MRSKCSTHRRPRRRPGRGRDRPGCPLRDLDRYRRPRVRRRMDLRSFAAEGSRGSTPARERPGTRASSAASSACQWWAPRMLTAVAGGFEGVVGCDAVVVLICLFFAVEEPSAGRSPGRRRPHQAPVSLLLFALELTSAPCDLISADRPPALGL